MTIENEQRSQADVVNQLLRQMEAKLSEQGVKVTLADYIRLVQLQKELADDEPREIRVTWVDQESASLKED